MPEVAAQTSGIRTARRENYSPIGWGSKNIEVRRARRQEASDSDLTSCDEVEVAATSRRTAKPRQARAVSYSPDYEAEAEVQSINSITTLPG